MEFPETGSKMFLLPPDYKCTFMAFMELQNGNVYRYKELTFLNISLHFVCDY